MHRLIVFEGLPCSGKSTAAKRIADALHYKNVDEGTGDHPADYEYHAYLDEEAMKRFSREDLRDILSASEPAVNGAVVPLSAFEGDPLLSALLPYKIYDGLPWETERPVMLDKWERFVEQTAPDETYVFNCVLMQNAMCETMMRFDLDIAVSAAYIKEICEIIRPLDPLIVYLERSDTEAAVMRASRERGEKWLQSVIRYHCSGRYGKRLRLSGFDGYVSALRERQERELQILKELPADHIILNDPQRNWEKAYAQILKENTL